ncbi:proton-conducting transporter transmembrane domain-containing protein [Phycicoccus flavus]|uniref:NADH-quinone oxidoreductase subunit L n=1 Tax=Phycicoccus flavus TaxID=2502783 RepID=A0A8T6R603_9MICO|nr:proton-conducting transporter membrane subunit [Phycicoccus flavus]NHA67661.1 NADH-quinone oxidoreductase subunit L [Phycicoccus flavus]
MSPAEASLWALAGLPALVGGVLLVLPRGLADRVAPVTAVGVAAVTAVLAVVVAVARPQVGVPFLAGADLGLAVGGPAVVVAPTVAGVAALVLLGGAADVRTGRARFHGLMLLFTAAALLTVTATTLPALLLGWEVMGATSYALIGLQWREARRVSSGLTAFVTTRTTDLGLYLAAGAAMAGGGDLALDALAGVAPGRRDLVAAGVLVAALGKAAQVVLAFWLSRAMDGPAPVSALLHSAAMVAMGGYLLVRLEPLLAATTWSGPAAAWAGALTTVALGLVALGQGDLKQLLAASTSAQLGFVVLAAGVGAPAAGTAHLVAHAATKAALFLAAGAWLSALGTKALAGLRGQVATSPVLRVAATVALFSLAGVPPLSLWATKDLVLAAAWRDSPVLGVVGLAGAALSAAYAGTVLRVLWAPLAPGEAEAARALRGTEEEARGVVPGILTAAVVLLAAVAGGLGVLALPPVAERLARVVGGPLVEPGVLEVVGSGALSLLVVAAVWWRPVRLGTWAGSWGGVETAAHRALVRPTLALARVADRVDAHLGAALHGAAGPVREAAAPAADRADHGFAGGVVGTARPVRALAGWARVADERGVHGGVVALAGAVRRAGAAARRPQTGQLHQYYVQAVALVALGAVLLVLTR